MAFSLNRLELIGRLGHDPEMRYLQDGQAVTRFSVATDRPVRSGSSPETDWHQVICWGKVAEFAGNYLAKGRLVYVAGRVSYRTWESADGVKHSSVEVVANELIALDRRTEPIAEASGLPEEDLPVARAQGAQTRAPGPVPQSPPASPVAPTPTTAPASSRAASGQRPAADPRYRRAAP